MNRKDMTIEEIKNEVAKENSFGKFNTYDEYISDRRYHCTFDEVLESVNDIYEEAMQRYAELKCKEQQVIDCDSAVCIIEFDKFGNAGSWIDRDSIFNSPLATSKTT